MCCSNVALDGRVGIGRCGATSVLRGSSCCDIVGGVRGCYHSGASGKLGDGQRGRHGLIGSMVRGCKGEGSCGTCALGDSVTGALLLVEEGRGVGLLFLYGAL